MKLAVFLLAGGGIRLKPYTNDIPKCLVPVNDQKLLIRMLDLLQLGGIEKVILVIGYKGEKIQYLIGDQYGDMAVQYVSQHFGSVFPNLCDTLEPLKGFPYLILHL